MGSETVLADLFDRLERERLEADRKYNDALTALDRALQAVPELPQPPAPHDSTLVERLNTSWKIAAEPAVSDRSLKAQLRQFVWRVMAPTVDAQQRFNAAVVEHVNRNIAAQQQAAAAAAALVDTARRELEALVRFEWLLLQYLQTITGYIDTKDRSAGGAELREQVSLVHQRLVMVERELGRTADRRTSSEDRSSAAAAKPEASSDAPAVFSDAGSAVYLGFEDRFRGSTRDIRQRLEGYVPLFASAAGVLDIGCGRGEFLELLRDHGVSARGIDTNRAMVEECRSKQLDVEQADAARFLARQDDGALGGLVAIQVVEHFEPAYLVRVLELAYQKMRPGAPLVLETINPACWMAFFECYLRDLTHAAPLHPETLRYLVQASGFSGVNVEYRQRVSEADRLDRVETGGNDPALTALRDAVNAHADKLNARLFSSMDYAVIARR